MNVNTNRSLLPIPRLFILLILPGHGLPLNPRDLASLHALPSPALLASIVDSPITMMMIMITTTITRFPQ